MKLDPIPSTVFKRIGFYHELVALVSGRSTCRPDRRAGAIIIDKDNRVISMGYNGTPPGVDHCNSVGCMIYEGHCIGTLHAEMNALANLKVKEDYMIMFCSLQPCLYCLKMLLSFKIKKILYFTAYQDPARDFFLKEINKCHIDDVAKPFYGVQLRDRLLLPGDVEMSRVNIYGDLFNEAIKR